MVVLFLLVAAVLDWMLPNQTVEPPDLRQDDKLKLAFSMPFNTLDPYDLIFGAQDTVFPLIYSFLIVPRADGTYEPDLAVGWWSNRDETIWNFTLRSDAVFHDGRPVTAEDVVYSLNQLCRWNMILAGAVTSVDHAGPNRVVIRLKRRVPHFLFQVAAEGIIVPKPGSGSDGHERPDIGSGPFYVYHRDADRRVILVAFDRYYGPRPNLKAVDFEYVPDKDTIWMDFIHDEIQFCYAASPENVHFMRIEPDRYRLEGRVAKAVILLLFNNQDRLFSDPKLRRALARMLDIPKHIDNDLSGLAEICPGPLGRFSPYLPEDAAPIAQNWDQARRLLEQAGWQDSDQDHYRDRSGQNLVFDLLVPVTFQIERESAVYLQRCFNQFGIQAHLVDKRYDEIIRDHLVPGQFQACLTQFSTVPRLLHHLHLQWHSKHWGQTNVGRYRNEEVDRALDRLITLEDESEYAEPLHTIQRRLLEDQPAIWFYHPYLISAYSNRLYDSGHIHSDYYITFSLRRARLLPALD